MRVLILLVARIDRMTDENKIADLLQSDVVVVNVGLEGFASDLRALGVDVVNVDWAPPAGGNVKLANLLSKLGS